MQTSPTRAPKGSKHGPMPKFGARGGRNVWCFRVFMRIEEVMGPFGREFRMMTTRSLEDSEKLSGIRDWQWQMCAQMSEANKTNKSGVSRRGPFGFLARSLPLSVGRVGKPDSR